MEHSQGGLEKGLGLQFSVVYVHFRFQKQIGTVESPC